MFCPASFVVGLSAVGYPMGAVVPLIKGKEKVRSAKCV